MPKGPWRAALRRLPRTRSGTRAAADLGPPTVIEDRRQECPPHQRIGSESAGAALSPALIIPGLLGVAGLALGRGLTMDARVVRSEERRVEKECRSRWS